jgi:hypothetical protein
LDSFSDTFVDKTTQERKMYVDGYLLFAIYFIAVLALAVSAYALWSLEEIRKYYDNKNTALQNYKDWKNKPPITVDRLKGHWD